jgi:hypothetical protein
MALNFNTQGNLHQTINLTYEEFKQHFGTNSHRMQLLRNALQFLKIFHSCGCTDVYIGGSFVSKKKNPEDIDMCFDISDIKEEKLITVFPQFFDINQRGKIRRDLKCHIFVFDKKDFTLLNLLKEDRDGNLKGLVKLDLNETIRYA